MHALTQLSQKVLLMKGTGEWYADFPGKSGAAAR